MTQPDGYVKIRDRSKDIIISGGENISSIEVEEALYRHPAVLRGRGGRAAGREMGRDALRLRRTEAGRQRHRRGTARLLPRASGRFKVPRTFVFRELPKTSTGKIQKFVLRELARSASAIG